MLESKGKYPNIKIIDFGLSLKIKTKYKSKIKCGSPGYIAP